MRASPFSGDDPELSSERHGHLGQFFVGQSGPGTLSLLVGTLVQRKSRERRRWAISRPLPDESFLVGPREGDVRARRSCSPAPLRLLRIDHPPLGPEGVHRFEKGVALVEGHNGTLGASLPETIHDVGRLKLVAVALIGAGPGFG